jgi:hypothetical protein
LVLCAWLLAAAAAGAAEVMRDVDFLASLGDRSTGSAGGSRAAEYILKAFADAGLEEVGTQKFLHPTPEALTATLTVGGDVIDLYPWGPNMVYLPMTPPEGVSGPLLYVGDGSLEHFEQQPVEGSVVLMEMASQGNWVHAAMLGARALIFLDSGDSVHGEFVEKNTPTPIAFPRFWVGPAAAERLRLLAAGRRTEVTVQARTAWANRLVQNCYGLLPGTSPQLKDELVVVEAFYDASSHLLGLAPGADEAVSVAVMLEMVRTFSRNPPQRSVLFLATAGGGQGSAGMREFIWAATARKKSMKDQERALESRRKVIDDQLAVIRDDQALTLADPRVGEVVWPLVIDRARTMADGITREIQYRRALAAEAAAPAGDDPEILAGVEQARRFRRLSWYTGLDQLSADERALASDLLKGALGDLKADQHEVRQRLQALKSGQKVRTLLGGFTPVLFVSLNLSTRAPALGIAELGDTYPLQEQVRRQVRAFRLKEALFDISAQVARATGLPELIAGPGHGVHGAGAARPSSMLGCYCCDVAAVADLPAVTLATVEDHRAYWSTPNDTAARVVGANLDLLTRFVPRALALLVNHPGLASACEAGIRGFSSIHGQAMFKRQGELFADQPAPGTIICALQGKSVFRTMVFRDGTFHLPGVANKRVAFEKVILEPYGVDPVTGRVAWTADKKQTDKENYRVKVKGEAASVALTMFHCEQTDVLQVFDPRKMSHLTKVQLIEAATGALPMRYWYSRVDGRNTLGISIFLEKGTRFKLLMADTLLRRDLLLLNASQDRPLGSGFRIGDPPAITAAPLQVAEDLGALLRERMDNLHRHGIVNRYLEDLFADASEQLGKAREELKTSRYREFWERVISSWAKLTVIYSEVESTQRDVLTGVLFFIALFVPFAYCLERYLFCFRSIYQQIAAFFIILLMTIFTIKALHPAFQLTYSPMVVIIAFFIVGLSLLVAWIIFVRFEREMAELQQHATHQTGSPVSKWQAFGAGFAIGVSNLNRRKLRTALTCTTLVILTFTVMSFTNVKTVHRATHTRLGGDAPYRGVLLRHQYWKGLLPVALEDMRARFHGVSSIWTRAWINPANPAERTLARARCGDSRGVPVEGILGLGEAVPDYFRQLVVRGRWFLPGEQDVVLLPASLAGRLADGSAGAGPEWVNLQGQTLRVIGIFDDDLMERLKDLDENTITPAYMEISRAEELTEAEVEAMQAGEEALPMSERFRHARAAATLILPVDTCLALGGELKAITILPAAPHSALALADALSTWLAFPLFVGEGDIFFHSAGTAVRYQGVANLLVPILIVVFICLNTLIGHVHERRKEISIYTSVGLAPTHVGFLFIVEALSLAVLSTVVGYILAQLTANYLGKTVLFAELTFNYSSLASVACMFLVFSVVFTASLYPAHLAAELAMPDVNRSWTLPKPEDGRIAMTLPFLLKYDEEKGIMGFLTAFFVGHQDIAQGAFIVDDTNLLVDTTDDHPTRGTETLMICLFLRTNVWLAPFDFGIKQALLLHCCPSVENPGYLEIMLQMMRLSGEHSAWVRANRNFIKALRKQMLLWRLLDGEAKSHYGCFVPQDYAGLKETPTP